MKIFPNNSSKGIPPEMSTRGQIHFLSQFGGFSIGYGMGRKYRPIRVLVSVLDLNQNMQWFWSFSRGRQVVNNRENLVNRVCQIDKVWLTTPILIQSFEKPTAPWNRPEFSIPLVHVVVVNFTNKKTVANIKFNTKLDCSGGISTVIFQKYTRHIIISPRCP